VHFLFSVLESKDGFCISIHVHKDICRYVEEKWNTKIYLTGPLFFSRINGSIKPQQINDEYWHVHIDNEQYPNSTFTTLIYLSNFGIDFHGGKFYFFTYIKLYLIPHLSFIYPSFS
jgi:hypothetical protein